jgi:protein-disulfide isomerase
MRSAPLVTTLLVAIATARGAIAEPKGFDPEAIYVAPIDDAPARGPADAPVTIVVWSDFSCRYCNRVEPSLRAVERLYPGKLRWVFRHMPLDEDNTVAAEASLAAHAQGKFWPMKDRLFAVYGHVDRPAVEMIATELGLDMAKFRADLDSGVHRKAIAADVAAARALGISGTPTFFINGRAIRGSVPAAVIAKVIDDELGRARDLRKQGAVGELYRHAVAGGRTTADAPIDQPPRRADLDSGSLYQVGLGLPGHAVGPADALVTIVVWSDFECGFCVRNLPQLEKLRKKHGADLRVVYRHLPLPMHPHADLAAEAAVEAARQGKFWPFHDRLFADTDKLSRGDLEAHAAALKLDMKAFRAALDDRRHREAVAAEAAAGTVLGVSGTPTMFVNGSPVEGAVKPQVLETIVDAHMSAARALVANGLARGDVYGVLVLEHAGRDKSDPSRLPRPGEVAIELGPIEREAAVIAACRGHDSARAKQLAGKLERATRGAADDACEAVGVDLD